jgi:Ser/Thr protein kinase RdoA (MazF antagonist)
MESVAGLVTNELERWRTSAVEEKIFGTGDPDWIGEIVGRFCLDQLGSKPAQGLFYRSSVGCVFGMRLATGIDVVVKVYQERWTTSFLTAIQSVQRHLGRRGFPCPTPLFSARPLMPGRPNLVTAETWLSDPGMTVPTGSRARSVSAAGLARQIDWCRDITELSALKDHPLRPPVGQLYPEPHSPLFDFDATADSAEWIDEFTTQAARQREYDDGPPVAAHTDWSARNVRLGDEAVLAVYDWDSMALVRESTAVGQAAATWSVTSEPGGSDFPSVFEVAAFLRDYETAADRPLTDAQWQAAGAAATGVLAYTARCEHALAMTGRARQDQRGARDRLTHDGETLLDLHRAFGNP